MNSLDENIGRPDNQEDLAINANQADEFAKKLADATSKGAKSASDFADKLNTVGKTIITTADKTDVDGNIIKVQNSAQQGYASKGQAGTDSMAQQATDAVKAQFNESGVVQGARKISDMAKLVGIGGGAKTSAKANLKNNLYDSLGSHIGGKAVVKTGNVLKDYNSNYSLINSQLKSLGITNPEALTEKQINKALDTGKLGTIQLGDEEKALLRQRLSMDKLGGAVNELNKDGRLKTIGKAVISETFDDSDAMAGIKTAKTTFNIGKATFKFGKGVKVGVLNGAVGIINIGDKVRVHASSSILGLRAKLSNAQGKDLINNERIRISNDLNKRVSGRAKFVEINKKGFIKTGLKKGGLIVGRGISRAAGKTIGRTRAGLYVASKITNAQVYTKMMANALRNWRLRIQQNKLLKFLRAPFSAISRVSAFVKMMILKVVLAVAIILLAGTFIPLIFGIIFDSVFEGDSAENPAENSIAQNTINEMFTYQCAFENNMWRYKENSSDVKNKQVLNSKYLDEVGIPQGNYQVYEWDLSNTSGGHVEYNALNYSNYSIVGTDYNIINNDGIKYTGSDGTLSGYNLYNFFGDDTFDYEVKDELQEQDEHGEWHGTGEYEIAHLIGEAGIFGDVGTVYGDTTLELSRTLFPELFSNRESYFADDLDRVETNSNYYGCKRTDYYYVDSYLDELTMVSNDGRNMYSYGAVYGGQEYFDNGSVTEKGEEGVYQANSIYKGVISAIYGITDNECILTEEEYKKYAHALFYATLSQAQFNIEVTYEMDPSQTITVIHETSDGFQHEWELPMIRPHINLIINYRRCGMYDMAYLSDALKLQDTFVGLENADTFEGFFSKLAGGGKELHDNLTMAEGQYELLDEDWEYLYDCVFPTSTGLQTKLSETEIENLLNTLIYNSGAISDSILQAIKYGLELVGTPYLLGGKSENGSGLDCSGLINLIAQKAGVWTGNKLINSLADNGRYVSSIDFSNIPVGTIITAKNGEISGSDYGHIGMFIGYNDNGDPLVLESCDKNGVIVNNLNDKTQGTDFTKYHHITTPAEAITTSSY